MADDSLDDLPRQPVEDASSPLEAGLRLAFGRRDGGGSLRGLSESQRLEGQEGEQEEGGAASDRPRYRVHDELARGGMGVVYRGRDLDLDREVAIKMLRSDRLGNRDAQRRFLVEAKIGGQLQHPGIVPVYGIGSESATRPYIVMKWIQGRSLAELLAVRAAAENDSHRLLGVFAQVCQTVAFAHAQGTVHRDLKPGNVMVGRFGEVQVVDWGLAVVLSESESGEQGDAQRSAPEILGTPSYMPPEQARGALHLVDRRSDVFSLGAILCEILCGCPPYPPGDSVDLIDRATQADLGPALDRLRTANAPAELVRVCSKCLTADRQARFADAGELAEAVDAFLLAVRERAHRAEVQAARAEADRMTALRTRRLTLGLAASLLIILGLVVGFGLWREQALRIQEQNLSTKLDSVRQETDGIIARAEAAAPDAGRAAQLWAQARLSNQGAVRVLSSANLGADVGLSRLWSQGLKERGQRIERGFEAASAGVTRGLRQAALLRALQGAELRAYPGGLGPLDGRSFYAWMRRTSKALQKVFEEYDLSLDDSGVESLRGTHQLQFAAYLDAWALGLRSGGGPTREAAASQARVRAIWQVAAALDPDAVLRPRLMNESSGGSRGAVLRLAKETDPRQLTPAGAVFLSLLTFPVDEQVARQLLHRCQAAHPRDFRIQFLTATAEELRPGRPGVAAYAHYLAAQAIHGPSVGLSLRLCATALDDAAAADWAARARKLGGRGVELALADALFQRRDSTGALRAVRRALEDNAGVGAAQRQLARILSDLGRQRLALRAAERALDLEPRELDNLAILGQIQLRQGAFDAAEKSFRAAVKRDPGDPGHAIYLARVLDLRGRVDEALRGYTAGLKHPHATRRSLGHCHGRIALVHLRHGDHELAEAAVRRAIEVEPNWPGHHLDLALVLRSSNQQDAAEQAFERARSMAPEAAAVHELERAHELRLRGESAASLRAFARAQQLWSDATTEYNRAVACLENRDLDAALRHCRAALVHRPGAWHIMGLLGQLQSRAGDHSAAVGSFDAAISAMPEDAELHYGRGLVLKKRGRWSEAMQSFRRAARLEPEHLAAQQNLAAALVKLGKPRQAVTHYRAALRISPGWALLHCQLGLTLARLEDYQEALKHLRRGHELGSAKPGWKYPSADWVRRAERALRGKRK